MKYLIVGLGNIGPKYVGTRHNIGFMIADVLVDNLGGQFSTQRLGDVAQVRLKNKQLVVLKPSTFMNLSGQAVRYWMNKENIDIDNILVLVDDISLPFGAIRIKPGGSAGGHNGLKNISELLATDKYARLRFGIGSDFARGAQIDYVLGTFSEEEQKTIDARIDMAVDAVKEFCLAGIQRAMCDFNNR